MPASSLRDPRTFHLYYLSRLFVIVGITFLSGIAFVSAGTWAAVWLFDVSFESVQAFSPEDLQDQQIANSLKLIQFCSQVGFFLLPALLIPMIFGKSIKRYLHLKSILNFKRVILTILVLLIVYPVVHLSMYLNQAVVFPEGLAWLEDALRKQDEHVEALSTAFLDMPDIRFFLLNILLVAALPAIAEEFFFRGLLQNFFSKWWGQMHVAIWVTAVIFSLIHMQFFAFLPRVLLGATFGYILYLSSNMWYPVFAHFFNNFILLCIMFFWPPENEELPMAFIQSYPNLFYMLLLAFAILLIFTLYQLSKRKGSKDKLADGKWERVYTTQNRQSAHIIKGMLESNQITSELMDKRDSAYQAWGEIHVYVLASEASRALELVKEHEASEKEE